MGGNRRSEGRRCVYGKVSPERCSEMEDSLSSAGEGSTATLAECPVCHTQVPIGSINSHIDCCLREDTSDIRGERKRQSSLASFVSSKAKIQKEEPSHKDVKDL